LLKGLIGRELISLLYNKVLLLILLIIRIRN